MGNVLSYWSPKTRHVSGIAVYEPRVSSFEADAFFMIKGFITRTGAKQYALISVRKVGSGLETSYWVRGDFLKRIWLRFGPGDYLVEVIETEITNGNLNYEGDIIKWSYWTPPLYTFYVTNTNPENGTFYYPSDPVQSDDPVIKDLADSIVTGSTTELEKIRAIHDYVVKGLYYDDDSLVPGRRKKQDALTTLANGTAVCEGYTSLYNALLRSIGIYSKCIYGLVPGGAHAWSHLWYETNSEWLYVDTTWDDPPPWDDDPDGSNMTLAYFMKTSLPNHYNDPKYEGDPERPERSIQADPVVEHWIGYPDGIY